MKIEIHGAAGGEVTGSAYVIRTPNSTVLVDIGMFQGGPDAEARNQLPASLDPSRLDAVVLTHAHLDHTGRLPLLFKHGFRGPVYSTPATVDLAEIILKDSAKLQEQDAVRTNRKRERAGQPPVEPLYRPEHIEPLRVCAREMPLHASTEVAPGIRVRGFEAGHLLGSASLEFTIETSGRRVVVVFSGDLGPTTMPIIREFEPMTRADVVFLESTYGDREHRPYGETVEEFTEIVRTVTAKNGKILVPTFAIGRAQQILYHLAILVREGKVRRFPVYLDSPMAIEASKVYARHPELFDDEMRALVGGGVRPLDPSYFRASVTAEDSKKLNELEGPCLILAGAGMCNGGRILHHLKQNLWKSDTHVLIVGFQGRGSLGRRLIEGEKLVTIHGEPIAVRAQIHTLGGFSAHAGQSELLQWFSTLAPSKPRVVLTHGEDKPRTALAGQLLSRFGLEARCPGIGEEIELG
ncbi:MAG: MBL fold metallo-hydrolase [Verrucomicrobiales bacterium]|nr:MBL fold metallo-hydrolase [Verrucomicrobiales bacterium]